MRRLPAFAAAAALAFGCSNGAERNARDLVPELPERSECAPAGGVPSEDAPIAVRVVELCLDDAYGDYGVPGVVYITDNGRGPLEQSLRATLSCCPDRSDDLIGVSHEDGTAVLEFPPEYIDSSEWGNVSTAEGSRRFVPPLIETAFLFPEVTAVAMRFGDRLWWPLESSDTAPIGRDSGWRVPLEPRPEDPAGPIAATRLVARELSHGFRDESWREDVVGLAYAPGGVLVETDLAASDLETARAIVDGVDGILDRDERWCLITVRVAAEDGTELRAFRDVRTCDAAAR